MDPKKRFQSLAKYQQRNLKAEIEALLEKLGYSVVYGKGNFKEGTCLVEQHEKVVVNHFSPLDLQLDFLLQVLSRMDLSDIYVLPAVRELIEAQSILDE